MKKRTGKMISLSLAVALAVTAAPVTALADENTQSNVIETSELTPAQNAGETGTDTTTVDTKEEEGLTQLEPATVVAAPVVDGALIAGDVEETKEAVPLGEATIHKVDSQESLENAISNAKYGDTIKLTDSFKVTNNGKDIAKNEALFTLPEGVTLDGDNKTITADDTWESSAQNHIVGIVNAKDTKICNLTIVGNENTRHGINVFGNNGDTSMDIEKVTVKNCGTAGIVVNGATVTATDITTENNAWGAINVDKAGNFTLTGNCNIAEANKVWSENTSNATIDVDVDDWVTMETAGTDSKTYYTDLEDVNEVLAGISDYGDTTVKLTEDVTVSNDAVSGSYGAAAVALPDNVTLNGGGYTISADEENWASENTNHILGVTDGTVAIKNVTIVGNAKTKSGIVAWQGDGSEVNLTLTDVEIQNCGNAALQVNSATVTATDLKTSGNSWGAVNVDKASGNINDTPSFTLSGEDCKLDEPTKVWTEIKNGVNSIIKDETTGQVLGTPMTDSNDTTYYGDAVAQIGDTKYPTLAEALNHVAEGGTITLLADATVNSAIVINAADVTIDGDNHAINVIAKVADNLITVNGNDFTLQDVTINGNENVAKSAVHFYNTTGGKVTGATINGGGYTSILVNGAEVTVKDSILNPDEGAYANIEYGAGSVVTKVPKLDVDNVSGKLSIPLVYADQETIKKIKELDPTMTDANAINKAYITGANLEVSGTTSVVEYTITFDPQGGTLADGEERAKTNKHGKLDTLPTPERSRYRFDGWFTADGTEVTTNTVFSEDTTIHAEWTRTSSGGSHKFDNYITVITPKNGEVSVSDDWAYVGDKVTLTVIPDKGYEVDKIEIVDDEGDKIDAKKVEDKDDKYTFRMANCDVTVTVTFKEEGKTTEDTDKEEDKDDESTETTELNFTDVKESDWFFKGVEYVVDKGIMSGVSENEFAPSGKLTRAMLVQMLYNMESRPACDAENAFMDVPVGQWYTDAVIWANDAKIVSGMGEDLFAPNMEITREQMVAMLYNYAKYKGYDVTASADLSAFADTASVSTWAQPAMQWAVAEGYISGMGDSQLAPQGTATRAEIASVIMRFMEATAESAETAE